MKEGNPVQMGKEGAVTMARTGDIEKMSLIELKEMETRIARLVIQRREEERAALKEQIAALAREHGFDVRELVGRGKGGNGSVAPKYRDPQNPGNTWSGRGRMPRWLVAATKGGKVKKEEFLIG
ncbi:MAG TPA: H-NS histone family protein [Bryobacteraceae bacterium]|jgi:DNA-binding protein H-NS